MAESPKLTGVGTPADQPMPTKTREDLRDAVMLLVSQNRLSLKSLVEAIQPDLTPDEENELSRHVAQWFSEVETKLKPATEATPTPDLGIQPTQLEGCLVPSGEGSMPARNGSNTDSEPFGPRQAHPRTELAIEILRSLGTTDLEWFKGENEEGMLRMLSYNALVSKQLGKAVLVCDEEGNRTFVIHTLDQAEQLWKLSKAELMAKVSTGEVTDLLWQDPKDWRRKLGEMLDPIFVAPKITRPRDQAYYTDPESVKADLEAFAKGLGEGKNPFDLSTAKRKLRFTCSNGETEISWHTWIDRATVSLGKANNTTQAARIRALTLETMLKIAGYEIRDGAYYADPKKIKHDLELYTKKLGEGKTPMDLNIGNMRELSITCANGEKGVNGNTWQMNASVALGISRNSKEAQNNNSETLKLLLKKAGYEIAEFPLMDRAYYSDPANLEHDLGAFASFHKIEIESLNIYNFTKANVRCANGETVNGHTWLVRAVIAFGKAKKTKEATNILIIETFNKLKRKIGIDVPERKECPPMDSTYFAEVKNIQSDLQAIAKACGCQTIKELNINKMKKAKNVQFTNGETFYFSTYLHRAAIGFKMANNSAEAGSIGTEILRRLKEKIGIVS